MDLAHRPRPTSRHLEGALEALAIADIEVGARVAAFRKDIVLPDPSKQLEATRNLRIFLSSAMLRHHKPSIAAVLETPAVVAMLVSFLDVKDNENLKSEATHAVSVLVMDEKAAVMVAETGGIPFLVNLLSSDKPALIEHAVMALGHIAATSPHLRSRVLQTGLLDPLAKYLATVSDLSTLREGMWLFAILCSSKPQPRISEILPFLPRVVKHAFRDDAELAGECLWAIAYITDGSNDRLDAVLSSSSTLPSRLVALMTSKNPDLQLASMRAVGNFVTGNDRQTQLFVSAGALPRLYALLSHENDRVRKEAAWSLSNVAAGTVAQVDSLLAMPGLMPRLLTMLRTEPLEIKREVCWIISNMTSVGKKAQIQRLVDLGAVPALTSLLTVPDQKSIMVSLEGIENILKSLTPEAGEAEHPVLAILEECSGMDRIEELQKHAHHEISERASSITQQFFEGPDPGLEGEGGFGGFGGFGRFGELGGRGRGRGGGGRGGGGFDPNAKKGKPKPSPGFDKLMS